MLVIVISILIPISLSATLPANFTKCNRNEKDFNECLRKAVVNGVKELASTRSFKEYGVESMAPLTIPTLTIEAGSGAVKFDQHYKNLQISGYDKIECSKVEMNFDTKMFTMDCLLPKTIMKFQYEISGKILLLPISGIGPGTITIEQFHVPLTMKLEEYEKKGKKHFKVTESSINLTAKKMVFDLENLFNGDKILGDNILKVLNENWLEIYNDVKPSYDKTFAQIYALIFDKFLQKISIDEMFDGK